MYANISSRNGKPLDVEVSKLIIFCFQNTYTHTKRRRTRLRKSDSDNSDQKYICFHSFKSNINWDSSKNGCCIPLDFRGFPVVEQKKKEKKTAVEAGHLDDLFTFG